MQRHFTIAAASIAALCGTAQAQSSVTLYGLMDVAVRRADNAAAGGGSLTTMNDGAFTGSRVGYFLSKRSDVYAALDNNKLTGAFPLPGFMGTRDSATGLTVGLRHRF